MKQLNADQVEVISEKLSHRLRSAPGSYIAQSHPTVDQDPRARVLSCSPGQWRIEG